MAVGPETLVFPVARRSSAAYWFTVAIVGILSLLPALLILIPFGPGSVVLEVSKEGLRIRGSMYGRLIQHPDSTFARRLTAVDMPAYSPTLRTNGVGLPNYQGGWFRLKNGGKALLFVTDWSKVVIVPTSEGFTLMASPADSESFLTALAAYKATPQVFQASEPQRFPLAAPTMSGESLVPHVAVASIAPLLLGSLLGFLTWSSRRIRFEVSPQELRIRGLYGRRIAHDALDVKGAQIVDLKVDPSYRGMFRTNGIGMPGYCAGWFRFKGSKKALLFVTDWKTCVTIPTSLGYTLVVSPADPEGLLSALRETAISLRDDNSDLGAQGEIPPG